MRFVGPCGTIWAGVVYLSINNQPIFFVVGSIVRLCVHGPVYLRRAMWGTDIGHVARVVIIASIDDVLWRYEGRHLGPNGLRLVSPVG